MEKELQQIPKYWKSLEEFAQSPEFIEAAHREFPEEASVLEDPISRRRFVQLMGASMAFAGLTSCRMPKESLVPYVKDPEGLLPGQSQYYASAFALAGHAQGVLVKSNEGRPTKIEGNKLHVQSQGVASIFAQAAVLSMFNPERLKAPMWGGKAKTWLSFFDSWKTLARSLESNKGKGLVLITESVPSRSFAVLKQAFHARFPEAKWLTHEAINRRGLDMRPAKSALSVQDARYDLKSAKVIASFNEDFLGHHPEHLRLIREFSAHRKPNNAADGMNRLYMLESSVSVTGTNADHRLALRPSEILGALQQLATELGVTVSVGSAGAPKLAARHQRFIKVLADDLRLNPGQSLVAVGPNCGPQSQVIARSINERLGNLDKTLSYAPVIDQGIANASEERAFLQALNSDSKIDALLVLGANPAYTLASAADWGTLFKKAKFSAVLSDEPNETTALSQWVLPRSHFLESWLDVRSADGSEAIAQPIIEPLFDSKSSLEFMALLAKDELESGHGYVLKTWQSIFGEANFKEKWQRALHDGVVVSEKPFPYQALAVDYPQAPSKVIASGKYELHFSPSYASFDGRFASNAWLQEVPHPVTKVVWNNPVILSHATASELGAQNGREIEIQVGDRKVTGSVWVLPGHPDGVLGLTLGYGRTKGPSTAVNVGADFYPVFNGADVLAQADVKVLPLSKRVVSTQNHWSMEGRPIIRSASLAFFKQHPEFAKHAVEHPPLKSLWEEKKYNEGYQWGMTIDLSTCIGCSSCSIACQSENNIPVVGEDQVEKGREMQWIRIDRYFEGENEADPQFVHQPMMCQHCENAPCEQVCPVNATVHDDEGLNAMAYNRCIGTRYCSNNCPYKVRRFNFLDYTGDTPELQKMANNPRVTVRARGVMEKCTYCIQRINEKKHEAKIEGRTLSGDEVVTACQQACPAGAIEFGNILDKESRVAKAKQSPRSYEVLAELNVKPRTSYLARIRNLNPALVSGNSSDGQQSSLKGSH